MSIKEGRIDVKEAADYLGMNVQSIRAMCRKNTIGYLRVGRSYYFTHADLNQVVKRNTPLNDSNEIIG